MWRRAALRLGRARPTRRPCCRALTLSSALTFSLLRPCLPQPELTCNVQKYSKTAYLRKAEAEQCQVGRE